MRKKIIITLSIILAIFLAVGHLALAHEGHSEISEMSAIIYYNEACGMCSDYVNAELPQILNSYGLTNIVKKDYLSDKQNRVELNALLEQYQVPFSLQSHIMTFVGNPGQSQAFPFIFGGHVPRHLISDAFSEENQEKFGMVLIYQDEMHGEAKNYQVLARPFGGKSFVGQTQTYPINEPLDTYLDYLVENQDNLPALVVKNESKSRLSILPLVLVTGFLDGFNPCAFAVMIFFIAFLFTLKRRLRHIVGLGLLYIAIIYLTYFGIGLGLFKAILITGSPHLMAKIGSWLVIVLGLINIKDYLAPKLPFHLQIPKFSQGTLQYWLTKATLPAVIVAAFLVGLCTFPCSGGIYVAIVGLLATQSSFWLGLFYLVIYNVMFVLPLVFLLALVGNKLTLGKIAEWQSQNDKLLKFVLGLTMIGLGVLILLII